MVEQALGILAVWILWTIAEPWIEAPRWMWLTAAVVLGVGWECLINPSYWWLGVGIGGGAAVLMLLTDLIMLATDACKVLVLRNTRGKGP